MPLAISLRADFNASDLGRLARRSQSASQARRLLALAATYDGGTRSEAARLGDVTLQPIVAPLKMTSRTQFYIII